MADQERDPAGPEVQHEIEHGHAVYTDAELLEQSQLNAQSLALAMFDAIGDDQEVLNRLVDRVTVTFANAWDTDREWQPAEVLDALLTNFRSFGAMVESYEPDADRASAVLTGLPSSYLSEILGVSPARFRPMLAVSQRLAEALGCELEWSHDASAGRVRLQVGRSA